MDSKGRVIIPASYREALGENFTIALNGSGTAIALYPQAQWEHVRARLARISDTDTKGMQYKRLISGNAFSDNTMDTQGRVLLPGKLRTRSGIAKDLVFVGMGNIVEIWDAAKHGEDEQGALTNFDDLLQHMEDRYADG